MEAAAMCFNEAGAVMPRKRRRLLGYRLGETELQ